MHSIRQTLQEFGNSIKTLRHKYNLQLYNDGAGPDPEPLSNYMDVSTEYRF